MPSRKHFTPAAKVRVLVLDSHPLVRDGLDRVINQQVELVCCGTAGTVPDALVAVAVKRPELVIMDLRLKGGDGLELIKSLKAQYPSTLVLVCSQDDDRTCIENAFRAGARGYLVKEHGASEVIEAVRTVLAGEVYRSRGIAELHADGTPTLN